MSDQMLQTRATAADWATADPTLDAGQLGYETDTGILKCGDGLTAWTALAPLGGGGDADEVTYDPTASGLVSTDVQAALDEIAVLSGGTWTGDPVDNPTEWGADLGYDAEWASGSAVPSGWGWVNQGTATATRTMGRLLLEEPTAASGNNLRLIDQPIPGASAFTATAKLTGRIWPPAGTFGHYISLRESVGGKIITFGMNGQGASTWSLGRWEWGAASGATPATPLSTVTDAVLLPRFWRIRKNTATSWDFLLSLNGIVWDTAVAGVNVSTYLGAAPTHIGVGLWRNNVVTAVSADWFRIR